MRQAIQIDLASRVLAHLAAETTDCAEAPSQCSVAAYTNADRYAAELEVLFRRGPVFVAHQSALPEPGDFITRDVARVPLLLVRQNDGSIAGFINVCRHRGTCVVDKEAGKGRKSFVCPYHGWTYGRDGTLRGLPDGYGFDGVEVGRESLVRISTQTIAGFIAVATAPAAGLALKLPAEIADDLGSFAIASHHVYAPRITPLQMNWKLALDIFLEAYHLRVAHRDSIYKMFFDNVGLVDRFAPHLRNVFPKRTIGELTSADPQSWSLREHANIIYLLFPNTIVLIEPDHAAVLHVLPTAIDRCVLFAYTLVPEKPDARAARYWDKNNEILYSAIAEDFALGASIQRGLASGANEALRFARFEHALTYFHESVAQAVG